MGTGGGVVPERFRAPLRVVARSLRQLLGGTGTAVLALGTLVAAVLVSLLCLVGIGIVLLPSALRAVRWTADQERARLNRWGAQVVGPGPIPSTRRQALADTAVRRDARWLTIHATWGLLVGLVGLCLPVFAIRDFTFPLWWWAVPADEASAALPFWVADSWPEAWVVALSALGWALLTVAAVPPPGPRADRERARAAGSPAGHRPVAARRRADRHPGRGAGRPRDRAAAHRAVAARRHAEPAWSRVERADRRGAARAGRRPGRRRRPARPGPERRRAGARRAACDGARHPAAGARRPRPRRRARRPRGELRRCRAPSTSTSPARCAASVEASAVLRGGRGAHQRRPPQRRGHASVTVRRDAGRLEVVDRPTTGTAAPTRPRGSGLAGIRRRVEAHDGTFAADQPAGRADDDGRGAAMRIVIAEDDAAAARRARAAAAGRVARRRRHRSDAAGSSCAAVDEHRARRRVVDVRMPPTHTDEGIVAAVEARRRQPGLAILVLSAYVEQAFATDLLDRRRAGPRLPAQGAGGPGRGVPRGAAPRRRRRHGPRPGRRGAAAGPQPAPIPALARLTDARGRGAGADGRGTRQHRDRRAARSSPRARSTSTSAASSPSSTSRPTTAPTGG